MRPAKTQIRLRIRAVWSESSLIACALYSLWAIQRGKKKNPYYIWWMYIVIWIFAGHTGSVVNPRDQITRYTEFAILFSAA